MYYIEWSRILLRTGGGERASADGVSETHAVSVATDVANPPRRRLAGVDRTVWALGFTSLLTDISSEMISSILPLYLVLHLGMSPLMFGVVDGLYQGAAIIVRVAAGVLSDRWQCHKAIAALGYGLSAICRLLLLTAGSVWGAIAAVVALDRVGKGIRTAPRDALIAQRTRAQELSTAFGVHRTMDAAGAMLGPVVAFGVLALMPGMFDVLFVLSFAIAVIGVGVILLFVPSHLPRDRQVGKKDVSMRTALGLLAEPRFRAQVTASVVLGLSTISDSFLFLILQRSTDLPVTAFPLLYVGTSFATALFAAPFGRLADRFGRRTVLTGGYCSLVAVYLLLLIPVGHGATSLCLAVLFFGIYYAATDGVFTAMAASVLPDKQAGSGLAVLATATNLARVTASVLFGLLWSRFGIAPAVIAFLLALLISIAIAFRMLNPSKHHVGRAPFC